MGIDRIILVEKSTRDRLTILKVKTRAKSYDEVINNLMKRRA